MFIGLLITARCNATCEHCSTSCGPTRTEALGEAEIKRVMDEAAAIPDGKDLEFCLSGGEVFLDFPLLLRLVAHGRGLGAKMSCVTNGYWAANDARARDMLEALRDAGLAGIAVSTSRFHQQFIRRERVGRALRIAKALGLHTVLKCPVGARDRAAGELEQWARAAAADELELFRVMPAVREGVQFAPEDFETFAGLPEGACPGAVLTVREDGNAYTCCNAGAFTRFLRLGNIRQDSVQTVDRAFRIGGAQQVLRQLGPAHFAREAIARGHGGRLKDSYGGVCELCSHIGSDPVLAQVAAEVAETHSRNQVRAIVAGMREAGRRTVHSTSSQHRRQGHGR